MIPTALKQRLRQNQQFERLASKTLDLSRENAFDWYNANQFTNKDGSVSTKGWESSHYHAFARVSFSVYCHFDSILNGAQLKCNSYKLFKQLSVLWYCLISSMFSEEESSCEEIDIYVKLFLSACNAFGKAANKLKKGEKDCSRKRRRHFLFIINKLFQSIEYV